MQNVLTSLFDWQRHSSARDLNVFRTICVQFFSKIVPKSLWASPTRELQLHFYSCTCTLLCQKTSGGKRPSLKVTLMINYKYWNTGTNLPSKVCSSRLNDQSGCKTSRCAPPNITLSMLKAVHVKTGSDFQTPAAQSAVTSTQGLVKLEQKMHTRLSRQLIPP